MAGWLPSLETDTVMSEQRKNLPESVSFTTPSASQTAYTDTGRMYNSADVRGPAVYVHVNMPQLGLVVHTYTFRVHDMAQWLDRWEVDSVKKNVQTYLRDYVEFQIRRRHFELELWLEQEIRWEHLPYDANFREVATRYHLSRKQEDWYFRLRLNGDRTPQNCGDW